MKFYKLLLFILCSFFTINNLFTQNTLDFDGSNDEVTITSSIDIANKSFTVEFWAKRDGSGSEDYVFSHGSSTGSNFLLHIGFRSNNQFTFAFFGNDLNVSGYADNVWHHWACVYDKTISSGDNRFIYRNGVLISSNRTSSDYFGTGAAEIGDRRLFSAPFNGQIDELRIWEVARSQSEIQDNSMCEISASEVGLLAYYKFNQGIAGADNTGETTLLDETTNNHDGTLNNFALNETSSNWVTATNDIGSISKEIKVTGNELEIADGASVSNISEHTHFKNVLNGATTSRTFTIQNLGCDQDLTISNVSLTGSNKFSITSSPATTLTPLQSTTLTIEFSPDDLTSQTATVNITNDDGDEGLYTFDIRGIGGASLSDALDFDGVDNQVIIDNTIDISGKSFSIEFWAKRDGTSSNDYLFAHGISTSTYQYLQIGFTSSNRFRFDFLGNSITTSSSYVDNDWHHWACVYDKDIASEDNRFIYRDGILVASNRASTDFLGSGTITLGDAALFSNYDYKGQLTEFRIWSEARSQENIANNRFCEMVGSESNLDAYYRFNQGYPEADNSNFTVLEDATSNENNGILNNFALTGSTSNWISNTSLFGTIDEKVEVFGNGAAIESGATTSSPDNHTTFISDLLGNTRSRTFTLYNIGCTDNITLGTISLSGSTDFMITSQPASTTLVPNQSTTFTIEFTSSDLNTQMATVNIPHDGTDNNPYTFTIEGTAGIGASALDFDGGGDRVTIPEGINLSSKSFTIEFWAKRNGTTIDYVLTHGSSTSANRLLSIYLTSNSLFVFDFRLNGLVASTDVSDGNWHHWACVYDAAISNGDNRFIYKDGVLVASDRSTSSFTGTGPIYLGETSFFVSEDFAGQLDELRIWEEARSKTEIANYRYCALPGSEPNLLAYYDFDQGIADGVNTDVAVLEDRTTNNHDGTLTQFSLTGTTSNWITGNSPFSTVDKEIEVYGNNRWIENGASTTSLINYTIFNSALVGSASTRTFTIANVGCTDNLSVGTVSHTGSTNFTVTNQPATSIAPGTSTTFTIEFGPSDLNTQTATVSFTNGDPAKTPFTFAIEGKGGVLGQALEFDGVDDMVTIPQSSSLDIGTNQVTLEAWVKLEELPSEISGIASILNSIENSYILFENGNTGELEFLVADADGTSETPSIPSTMLMVDTWHHIVGVYDGNTTTASIYLDGQLIDSHTNASLSGLVKPGQVATLGGEIGSTTKFFGGSIDEVRIWNTARTESEIQSNRYCELTGTESGLVAYYPFNQHIADGVNLGLTSLDDITSNNNEGTLTDFALNGVESNWILNTAPFNLDLEIEVKGDLLVIANGDITPDLSDLTIFEGVSVGNSSTRTYTIYNNGCNSNLTISTPTLTGSSDFSITSPPAMTIGPGLSSDFTVTFSPTTQANHVATINIINDDTDENPYSFNIEGTSLTAEALHFDGVNDRVDIGNALDIANKSFTIEFWAKRDETGSTDYILTHGSTFSTNQFLHLGFRSTNQFTFAFYSNDLNLSSEFSDTEWHHWACVYDKEAAGDNQLVYRDGILVGSRVSASDFLGSGQAQIGAQTSTSFLYAGYLDEFRIWDVAKTQTEIQNNRFCEVSETDPNLLAYYQFNEGIINGNNTGITTLPDTSSNSNTGTLVNFDLTGNTSNWVKNESSFNQNKLLNIKGNDNLIVTGDESPSLTDYTLFEDAAVGGVKSSRTYTILNNGCVDNLNISNITFSGSSDFTVINSPTTLLAPGETTSLIVEFAPTAQELKTATVTITSDDDNSPFTFTIQGTGRAASSALDFDGSNDYVATTIPLTSSTNTDFTLETWINIPNFSSSRRNIITGSSGSNSIQFRINTDGTLLFGVEDSNALWKSVQSSQSIITNTWYHVAVIKDGSNVELFINGS